MSTTNIESVPFLIGLFIGLFVGFVFTLIISISVMDASWKRRLVEKDVAEYYLNEGSEREWRLLIDKEEKLK